MHRQPGGLINIDLIDLKDICRTDRPTERTGLYVAGELFTRLSIYDFAVAETLNGVQGIKDNGSSEDRTKEAASTHLINSGNARKSAFARTNFVRAHAPNGCGRRLAPRLLTA